MLKNICHIQNRLLTSLEELNGLRNSLRDEYMFMARSEDLKNPVLKAKERQVYCVNFLIQEYEQVFSAVTSMVNTQFKLEACSFYHGVSLAELMAFVSRPLKSVQSDIKYSIDENFIQVPDRLRNLLPPVSENEVREVKRELTKVFKSHYNTKLKVA